MRLILKGSRIHLTPDLKAYVEEKIVRMVTKVLGDDYDLLLLEVELKRATKHHQKGKIWGAEANFTIGNNMLRAEVFGENPHEAIDILEDELNREIKRYKEKKKEGDRKSGRALKRRIKKSK